VIPVPARCRCGARIVHAFDADPTLTSYQIAETLNTDPTYVRYVLRKYGRKLMRGKGQKRDYRPN
jgi:hypothetical protein